MADPDPHRLSATEIVRRVEAGDLTAEAVVASCLQRIADRLDIAAWAALDPEQAVRRHCLH